MSTLQYSVGYGYAVHVKETYENMELFLNHIHNNWNLCCGLLEIPTRYCQSQIILICVHLEAVYNYNHQSIFSTINLSSPFCFQPSSLCSQTGPAFRFNQFPNF